MQNFFGRNVRFLAGFLLLLSIAGGWWVSRQTATAPGTPVIIFLIDTLRADRLGLYGYPRPTSPRMDAIAVESVVFNQANAPAPWTLPSVASILTSTFACEHGVVVDGKKLNPAFSTLAERLGGIGYRTAGFYANPYVGPSTGLEQGYERYRADWDKEDLAGEVSAYFDTIPDQPFFLYLHTIEPHDSFRTPGAYISASGWVSLDDRKRYYDRYFDYREEAGTDFLAGLPRGTTDNTAKQQAAMDRLAQIGDSIDLLYDASIRWSDDSVGAVIDMLKARGIWDKAVFILVSDHGEEFGEHGGWLHGQSVYEELVHVPLIIHFPGGEFGGRRIDAAVSLLDIMPTIFDYLGQPDLCDGCRGSTLMPKINGRPANPDAPPLVTGLRMNAREFYRPWQESRGDINIVVRQAGWKGIWNQELQSLELYELGADAEERTDLSARNPAVARRLIKAASNGFEACSARYRQPDEIEDFDADVKRQLRSLGYLN